MFKNKIIVSILAAVLLLVGLGVGLYLVRQQQDLSEKASPATNISFRTPSKTILVNDSFDVIVEVNANTNIISAADIEVNYDPQKLSLVSISPNSYLPTVLTPASVNNQTGAGSISLGAQVANPPSGKGDLATLKFKALTAGNASVSFGPKTKAAGANQSTDLLVSKPAATITVIATGAQASPTPPASPLFSGVTAPPSPSPSSTPVGGTATSSAKVKPTITLPANSTVKPGGLISGSSAASSILTLAITGIASQTVKADSTGSWSYALPTTITTGSKTITVTDSGGSASAAFTVSGASGTVSTPSGATPQAGSFLPTLLIGTMGFGLIILGALFVLP